MKAVLDTNVLIASVISTGVSHEVVVAGYQGEYQIVVSQATVAEFRNTLRKYPGKFQLDTDEIETEMRTLQYFAEFVDPDEKISAVDPDPDDDKFLEAAVAGGVDYLVSEDSHLLDLETFRGIDIVDTETFYESVLPS